MDRIAELGRRAAEEIEAAPNTDALAELDRRYLGKSGEVTLLMREVGAVPADHRPAFGQAVNQLKQELAAQIQSRIEILLVGELGAQFESERIDVTMPGAPPSAGLAHVLRQAEAKVKRVLGGMGFVYHESPELEQFQYNFTALNYAPDHPAMDEQDTFYIEGSDSLLLRTQCTALQGRVFESQPPPLRAFTVGRCYRNEAVDRTHGHTFTQVDAFMVDEGVSMAHLKGTLGAFARAMFGQEVQVRFRPDFFPFVEPGVDYAISTPKLFDGAWVELGGAGMVHPKILQGYGVDTDRFTGWAFGLGVERIPMLAYGVDDLRHFFENDLRFLGRFV